MRFQLVCPLIVFACVGSAAAGTDEKLKTTARRVLAKYDSAVVAVKIVGVTYTIVDEKPGPKSDFKAEVAGTILTANGLTAVCNYSTDFQNAAADDAGEASKQTYEITEMKLTLRDGRDVLADLVMRDEKLGVAFVAPRQRDMKFTYVPLDKGPLPDLLDDVIYLNRLGEPLKRGSELGVATVSAVMKQPHMLVVGAVDGGCAVFDSNGRPIGVTVLRRTREYKNVPLESPTTAVTLTPETLRPVVAQALKQWDKVKK